MKRLFVKTLGCAMNSRDSEHMIAELTQKKGYTLTEEPKEADLILINTCSVREKPVHKLFSEIGGFKKEKKPNAKIGVCGCTASHLGSEIIKRAGVSFVLGARNVSKISEVVDIEGAVEVDIEHDESSYSFEDYRINPFKANINISIGCDKSCTFCIVPNTRGNEISIPKDLIIKEIEKAINSGVKEVMLLGQNVNSYGRRFSDGSKSSFTKLLQDISKIEGLERIRFTSPHPLHMDDEFLEEFATNPKISKSMHMPLQSGSSEILKAMKRGYSKEWFLNRALKLRNLVPDVTISTDIIVGFPSESENDFLDSLDVVKEVAFEQLFSFVYSERPLTEAINFANKVPKEIAQERLERLQNLHKEIVEKSRLSYIGKSQKVLFEELKPFGYVAGKSDNNLYISKKGSEELLGKIVEVKIDRFENGLLIAQ